MPDDIRLDVLDRIEIASPCPARWEEMEGDDRSRFCAECGLHVHNFAAMTREEANDFLAQRQPGEHLCGQITRTTDGRIVTADDPVAKRTVVLQIRGWLGRAAAIFFGATAAGWIAGCQMYGTPMGGAIERPSTMTGGRIAAPQDCEAGSQCPDIAPCAEPSGETPEGTDAFPDAYPVTLGILDPGTAEGSQ